MQSLNAHDHGTPAATGAPVSLTIDGADVTVPAGTSVMRAAALAGGAIPKLCATDTLKAYGSCRLCLVEIENQRGYPASCTTIVAPGMKVRTESDKLDRLRRGVVELYLSDHPEDCRTCAQGTRCELHQVAADLGVTTPRYGYDGANHQYAGVDQSNPYFDFDPSACIVCSRCVRACGEVQGTFALTIDGRGLASKVVASQDEGFMDSECVSCGKANRGHACVKGRFAYGYATHADRITTPMIRSRITDPWQPVSWDEAFAYAASEFKRIQAKYGTHSVGGITSSRCTNEEAFLVQKTIRAALGTNNVDTCARVCHSPTGYGLKNTLGESAGTQAFDSVIHCDVAVVIGANPTEGHPVFGSRLKRRLREGAKLIVIDPREIELVRSPHVEADYHLQLRPGTNVALLTSLAHVIASENLIDEAFVAERCEKEPFERWRKFVSEQRNSPEALESVTGVPARLVRGAARLYANGGNGAIYYGLGVTEHSQGSTTVMAIANLAMATGNIGREGVGVNPLRGQNNVQGSCDMGSFPHELAGYRHIGDPVTREVFGAIWGVTIESEPGLRLPNMMEAALDGSFRALYVQGEDRAQSDPNTQHITAALSAMECVIVQDLFLNETAKYAHVFFPGSSFLEKDGTFTNAERRISRVRKIMEPLGGLADWEVTVRFADALGYAMRYDHPAQIMDEIAGLTPTFTGVSYEKLDREGSIQWPCNDSAPLGTPTMHIDQFVRGKGRFFVTEYVPTQERVNVRFPLILTTGRVLTQYNVGAQTRRTENSLWYDEDRVEIHPHDAEDRGVATGDWVGVTSRAGETVLRAVVTETVQPGVIYTTFHFPESGANVITTENSDWATNCPEYKVTAVQVTKVQQPAEWQRRYAERNRKQLELLKAAGGTGR